MKKIIFTGILLYAVAVQSQNIARVVEYFPAPGQHINLEQNGTPAAALRLADNENSMVSLGSFGGYVVLRFNGPCKNDPTNPYGIDFTIFGNAFSGSSEPGVVWVMKDENQNGEPDDVWHEIAGSRHFHAGTQKNYRISYSKTETRDINWHDNNGNTGILQANNYHTQEFYPSHVFFPDYPKDSVTFTGTRLSAIINNENLQELSIAPLRFGYADNHPKINGVNLSIPDNPYSENVEGAGGDPIDISWAVNPQGDYVELDEIHFVKIVTGYHADLGRLGEASTDVSYIVDTEKNLLKTGPDKLLVFYPLVPEKLLVGETVEPFAILFQKGKPTGETVTYQTTNSNIASVGNSDIIYANSVGVIEVIASSNEFAKKQQLKVVTIDSINIAGDFSAVYPGDTVLFDVEIFDNEGEPVKRPFNVTFSDRTVADFISKEGKLFFVALQPGVTQIECTTPGTGFRVNKEVKVLSPDDRINVYFTLKTEDQNLFPLQWINVGLADLNTKTENRQNDYSALNRLTLAHALQSGLQQADVDFYFRDDENSGGKMYLYSVDDEGFFYYGWGGKTEPVVFARAWVVRINNSHYLNGFDKIEVANGDTISLYHISDITSTWKYTQLTAGKDTAVAGESINLTAMESTCSFSGDSISCTGFYPLENLEIVSGESYFSNPLGVAEVTLDSNPPWIFHAGNDAILISGQKLTNARLTNQPNFSIYPNPAEKSLYISGNEIENSTVNIYTVTGEIRMVRKLNSNKEKLDIQNLNPGIYFLRLEKNGTTSISKFIKK